MAAVTCRTVYRLSQRDIILYNLGVGASEKELKWTFEGDDEFSAIPSFGVIPQFLASSSMPFDWLPNFNPVRLRFSSRCGMRIHSDERLDYCMGSNISLSRALSPHQAKWSLKHGKLRACICATLSHDITGSWRPSTREKQQR